MELNMFKLLLVDKLHLTSDQMCELMQEYDNIKGGIFKKKISFWEFITSKDLVVQEFAKLEEQPISNDSKPAKEKLAVEQGVRISDRKITVDPESNWTTVETLDKYCAYKEDGPLPALISNKALETMTYKWGAHCGDMKTQLFNPPKGLGMIAFNMCDISSDGVYNFVSEFSFYARILETANCAAIFRDEESIRIETPLLRQLVFALKDIMMESVVTRMFESVSIDGDVVNVPLDVTLRIPMPVSAILTPIFEAYDYTKGQIDCVREMVPFAASYKNLLFEVVSDEEFAKNSRGKELSFINDLIILDKEDIEEVQEGTGNNQATFVKFSMDTFKNKFYRSMMFCHTSPMMCFDVLHSWQMLCLLYENDRLRVTDRDEDIDLIDEIINILKKMFENCDVALLEANWTDDISNLICQLTMMVKDTPNENYSDAMIEDILIIEKSMEDNLLKFMCDQIEEEGKSSLGIIKNEAGIEDSLEVMKDILSEDVKFGEYGEPELRDINLETAALNIQLVSKRDRQAYCLEYYGDAIYNDNPEDPYKTTLTYFSYLDIIDDYEEILREKLMLLISVYKYARKMLIIAADDLTEEDADRLLLDKEYIIHADKILDNCNHEEEPKVYDQAIRKGLKLLKIITMAGGKPVENPEVEEVTEGLREITKEDNQE